jgi:hypothetical protein
MNSLQIFQQFNGTEPIFGIASEAGVLKATPELLVFNAVTIPLTTFKTLKAVAVTGAKFRAVGDFIPDASVTLAQQTVTTSYLDAHWYIDAATSTDDWGEAATIEAISRLKMRDAFITFAKQIYEGTNADNAGFSGLRQIIEASQSVAGQASPMLNLTPTATGTYTVGDVYFVATGLTEVSVVWGNGGQIAAGPIQTGRGNGTTAGTSQVQTWQDIHCQAGLSVAAAAAVGMIKGINLAAATPVLTDEVAWQLKSMFAAGVNLSAVLMNSATLFQLQRSRNFTEITGGFAGAGGSGGELYFPAAPTTLAGLPVYVTDGIVSRSVTVSA